MAELPYQDDDDSDDSHDQLDPKDRSLIWISFVEGARELTMCPMPAVPRVGDLVNLGDPLVGPMSVHRVVGVLWQGPGTFGKDQKERREYLLGLTLNDFPPVVVYVQRAEPPS